MLTLGKTRGLARLANKNGHFCMVALDQRPPLLKLLLRPVVSISRKLRSRKC